MSTVELSGRTPAEAEVPARSMVLAPSAHNTQPWTPAVAPGELVVRERAEPVLPHHDPDGRDRAASCGAAVADLEPAVRTLGRPTTGSRTWWRGSPSGTPNRRASRSCAATAPSPAGSATAPFEGVAVPAPVMREIVAAGGAPDVEARPVRAGREIAVVTRLLRFAAEQFRQAGAYERELSLWTIRDERAHHHGIGVPASRVPAGSVPWAGLVRRASGETILPDRRNGF
ncbi:hypothetical protein [Amycolatopsis kentuckyensis]|uniref:hypothetical protein n=1 Tax=Amycolatopsis kentuckyensis TaxID=218823 RepID=UPI003564A42B